VMWHNRKLVDASTARELPCHSLLRQKSGVRIKPKDLIAALAHGSTREYPNSGLEKISIHGLSQIS
jgi:hypothetical protein